MKLSALTFAAGLAASAQASSSFDGASATLVLATALPPSLLSLAITNPASASHLISSEFAAGETPAWFSKLPHDVQTYLVPASQAKAPAPTMPSIKPMSMNGTNMTTPSTHVTTKKSTTTVGGTTVMGVTHTRNVGGSATPTPSPSAKPAAAGALGVPTALLGSALIGVVGLVGMLAL